MRSLQAEQQSCQWLPAQKQRPRIQPAAFGSQAGITFPAVAFGFLALFVCRFPVNQIPLVRIFPLLFRHNQNAPLLVGQLSLSPYLSVWERLGDFQQRIYQFVGWAKGLTRAHRQPESWMGTDAFAHPTQVFICRN
ncbi:MAG: hypothetical protein HC865_26285, partial [Cyanobacteria bacterium RU_5_0]|nr:hypothetical protein [Cyanobacteria bacterium RU_5_0]